MVLNIVTPKSSYGPFTCDSIHLCIADDTNEKGGGSYGIRYGHIESLMLLKEGNLYAFLNKDILITGKCGKGFANIEDNTVNVVVEYFQTK